MARPWPTGPIPMRSAMSAARPRSTPCSERADCPKGGSALAQPASMTEPPVTDQDLAAREGASIAVFKERRVLLVKRGRAPFAGRWSLPGGKTEPDEAPRASACRELKEETGIAVSYTHLT